MRVLLSVRSVPARVAARLHAPAADDAGMTTAEYAVGTVAACGFGGVLYEVVTNERVLSTLRDVVLKALDLSFL